MLISNQPITVFNKSIKPINFTGEKINKVPKICYYGSRQLVKDFRMNIDNMDKKALGDLLKKKAASLPLNIDSLFYNIGMYFNGDINHSEFIKRYCELTEPVYRRIAEGTEKEAFNRSYATEIDTLVKIRQAINKFNENKIQQNNFDNELNELIITYLKKPVQRERYFDK